LKGAFCPLAPAVYFFYCGCEVTRYTEIDPVAIASNQRVEVSEVGAPDRSSREAMLQRFKLTPDK
jgi:hypothetical protein